MGVNRLAGHCPVIGIRPIIDARQGMLDVRGSLEEQTMGMALAAKRLFEEQIRYTSGEPVRLRIPRSAEYLKRRPARINSGGREWTSRCR